MDHCQNNRTQGWPAKAVRERVAHGNELIVAGAERVAEDAEHVRP